MKNARFCRLTFYRLAAIGIILFLTGYFLTSYVVEIKRISGYSMEPTLSDGKLVVLWKMAYGIRHPAQNRYLFRWHTPQAGDLVFYRIDGRDVVKRCAAIGNTALHFVLAPQREAKQYGMLEIGTRHVALSRVQWRNLGGFLPEDEQKVPAGFILALGDNTKQSRDCRDYGFVSVESVCGRLLWN